MMLPEHFSAIERSCNQKFTYDGFADDSGHNAQVPVYSSPSKSFFSTDLAGQHVWINPPFTQEYLQKSLQHYLVCKMSDPAHTSACIVVPKWDGEFRKSLASMKLIKEYPAGTVLFSQPGTTARASMAGIPWPVQVYYDAPRIQLAYHAKDALVMTFDAKIGDACAVSLLDSGAKASFITESLVSACKLPIHACPVTEVRMADGSVTEVSQKCNVRVHLRNHSSVISAYVMPGIVPGIDIIHGEDWLTEHHAELCYSARPTVRLTLPNGTILSIKSRSTSDSPPPSAGATLAYVTNQLYAASTCEPLAAKQALKLIDRGARHFLMIVKTDDSTVSASRGGTMMCCPKSVGTVINSSEDSDVKQNSGLVSSDKLNELKKKYGRIFQPLPNHLPPDRGVGHTIPLVEGAVPPYKKQYRLSPQETTEVKRQVADFLAKGYIEPSTSPYGAPVLFVEKPDGTLRLVIDYRLLNRLTIKNRYPLPRIEDLLDRLSGASVFSSLDLASGYYQIRISEEDRPKTAFCTPMGLFQFRVLAMGLANSPSTFQAVMDKVFQPYIGKFVQVYLDDVIVYSKTPELHAEHLELVFKKLQEHEFYCNPTKCTFNQSEVKYLGHIVGKDGLKVDPKKIAVIRDWPTPQDVSQLRSFLGLANYFRRFVQGYSSLVSCLSQLTHKQYEAEPLSTLWRDTHQKAFDQVKHALTTAPCLVLPDFSQPFELISDASLNGTGAVLIQNERPVAYTSSKFSPAERNYTTGEQELLGVFNALSEWRCYLEGGEGKLTLVTDHNPLVYLQSQPNLSRKQARWMEFFSRFHYDWVYRPGRINVADPISRNPALCNVVFTAELFAACNLRGEAPPLRVASLAQYIIEGYEHDSWFADPKNTAALTKSSRGFWLRDGRQVMIPNSAKVKYSIMHSMHDNVTAGHPGIARTHELVSRDFWWPSMLLDITQYVRTCASCQENKASTHAPFGKLTPLDIPEARWESVSTDFIVRLPTTQHKFDAIAVFVDRLSKMVHLAPCRTDMTAVQFADLFVDTVVKLHGMPKNIVSDRDTKFTSLFWSQVCMRMGVEQCMSTAYHPQSDGQTERMNRVLEEMLRHYVGQQYTNWDALLPMAEFAINNSFNKSIQNTPFFLNYGQHPLVPVTIVASDLVPSAVQFTEHLQHALSRAKECLNKAQDRQKHYYDKGRKELVFSVGQEVLLNTKNIRSEQGSPKKLLPRWVGPFKVTAIIGQNAVKLQLPETWKIHPVFHVELVKPFQSDGTVQPPPPIDWLEDEPLYRVDKLLDHRVKSIGKRKVTEFFVKWQGYDSAHNSWEPESNLLTCDELIKEYWQRQVSPPSSRKRKASPIEHPTRKVRGSHVPRSEVTAF